MPQARASTSLVLCQDSLKDPAAAVTDLRKQLFDRLLVYLDRDLGQHARSYDKLGVLTGLDAKRWNNLVLSVWEPTRKGGDALVVTLSRFDRRRLLPVLRFARADLEPTRWAPRLLRTHQLGFTHAETQALRRERASTPSALDVDYLGYRGEPDAEGVRSFVAIRRGAADRTILVDVGIDVPVERIGEYAFPDMIEEGTVKRLKSPDGDDYRINLLVFVADRL